jgi:hypothetical protein
MSALEDAALAYAQEGLYVFPLQPHGKTPLTAHGLEDATVDPMTIETWWGRWPEANIGIRTGDLVVVDEDRLGALEEFAAEVHETIPATGVVRTGSGRHFWFDQPEGQRIRNTAGKLAPGIDTRGDGGYVVAPPSIHQDGSIYEWLARGHVTMPDWLAQRIVKQQPRRVPMPDISLQGTTAYGQRALEQEITAVTLAVEGTRNDTLNTASFALGQLVSGGEIDHHDAYASLTAAARAAGLPQAESQKTIASGFTAGLAEPRQAPETNGNRASHIRIVSEAETRPTSESLFSIETWTDFSELASVTTDFLVDELWPTQSLGFIASPPKKGKTWIGLSLALSVATGKLFMANFAIPKPRKVLYLALEGNRSALRTRIGSLCRGLSVDPDPAAGALDNLIFSYRPRSLNLADPAWAEALTAEVAENDVELVIVDVLRNAARIKEQDASEFADLRQLLEPTLALSSVALLHHFIKLSEISKERTPAERMSGSGAMYGALDIGMFITGSEQNGRKLRVEFDGRDIAMPEPISVFLEGLGHGPNEGFTYDDNAFWRGDIDEVDEQDVAVPSAVVVEIVRDNQPVKRAELIGLIRDRIPGATTTTIEKRLAKLKESRPPTLVNPKYGYYGLRTEPDDLADNSVTVTPSITEYGVDSLNHAAENSVLTTPYSGDDGVDFPLNHAGLRQLRTPYPLREDLPATESPEEVTEDIDLT